MAQLSFKCDDELADKLKAIAFELDVAASDLIRNALISGLPLVQAYPHLFFGPEYLTKQAASVGKSSNKV